ncbi:MAG: 4-hydroxy-tetrahydrodipicolinate synthase [Alphaproteobacteria bacterium]
MIHENKLKGVYTALLTPFKNIEIDEKAFSNLIEKQVAAGINGLVPCGSTGEAATLSADEHISAIKLCIQIAAKRVPVMASIGSNSTSKTIELAQHAQKAGADYLMAVAPYYNKPTPEGIYQHYKAINDAVDIPVIIYNIPGRSVINITDDTISRLAELKNIIGIKDATGDLERPLVLSSKLKKEFYQFSGEDSTALAFNIQGGIGCISVASNIVPELCIKLQDLWFKRKINEAQELNKRLLPLFKALFCETNPAPVKYAASLLDISSAEVRLPLVEINESSKGIIKQAMIDLGIL